MKTTLVSWLAASCLLLSGLRIGQAGEAGTAAPRPNVVLIMSDDMGFSDLGCYGGESQTPHLDGLAARGLRFTQFYNTARCGPTRASLLTGLYPHQAGMGHMTYDGQRPGYEGDLSRNAVTIAEALRPAGYATRDLAAQHPDRVKQLVADWEAWAQRARVLPWIWKPAYGEQPAPPKRPGRKAKKP